MALRHNAAIVSNGELFGRTHRLVDWRFVFYKQIDRLVFFCEEQWPQCVMKSGRLIDALTNGDPMNKPGSNRYRDIARMTADDVHSR